MADVLAATADSTGTSPGTSVPLRVYPRRWMVLFCYCVTCAASSMNWLTYAPIQQAAADYFATSMLNVNVISLVYPILYMPGTAFSTWATHRWGMRPAIVGASLVTALGAWLKYFGAFAGGARYGVSVLGACIAGFVQPGLFNLCSRISGTWFPASERDASTTAGSLVNPIGNAIISALSPAMVTTSGDVPGMLLMMALVCTATALACALFVPEKPETPPSISALERSAVGTEHASGGAGPWWSPRCERGSGTALSLLRDKDMALLVCGFGIGVALFNAFIALIGAILLPAGYSADESGLCAAVFIGTGILGAIIAIPIMQKTKTHRPLMKVLVLVAFVGVLWFFGEANTPGVFGYILGACALMGTFMMPILPAALENAAECSFPVHEDVGLGLMLQVGNGAMSVVAILVLSLLTDSPPDAGTGMWTPAAGFVIGWLIVALLCLLAYNGPYRRREFEEQAAKARNSPPQVVVS